MTTAGATISQHESSDERSGYPEKLRRFSTPELLFHWSLVIPYLAVGTSGMLLFTQRLAAREWVERASLLKLHLGSGVALIALPLIVLVLSPPGAFFKNLRECLRWRLADLWWFHAMAFKIFIPSLRVPREGRFNPGQKLNLLHVAFLVPILAVTGVILWIDGRSLLDVRILHVGLATLSLLFAGTHLYLALVNPSTCKALGGIFHGRVSASYAASHHPLWFEETTGIPCAREGTRQSGRQGLVRTLLMCSVLLIILPGADGDLERRMRPFRKALARLQAEPRLLIMPAPLSSLHASEAELETCSGCHDTLGGVARERCLECHDEVADRLAGSRGYHGTLDTECGTCHADHKERLITLDDRVFQHDLAEFPLLGAHRDTDCNACHDREQSGRRSYLGLLHSSCQDCHEDPHRPALEGPCMQCHQEDDWHEIVPSFNHDSDTSFPLGGEHARIACSGCHGGEEEKPLTLIGTPDSCESCHPIVAGAFRGELPGDRIATPSPHLDEATCSECHRADLTTERCSHCHPVDYDTLMIDWRSRVDRVLLEIETGPERKALERASFHNWEGVVVELRAEAK